MRVETIGSATLYLGNCREVLPILGKIDAVVTDPPYGIGFAAQPTKYQRANGLVSVDWDNCKVDDIVEEIAATKPAVIWGGNYYKLPPSRGWLICSKAGNAPSMADAEMAWTSRDMNTRVFEKSVKSASLEKDLQRNPHPTQKPVGLMEWSLDFMPLGIVLDPFMGSGTTGVACAKSGREFIGVEIDERYFDIACRRIEAAQRQADLFVSLPPPIVAKQMSMDDRYTVPLPLQDHRSVS